jgi:hypothetical protein
MAFATANIRRGTAGDLKLTAGDWTGSAGDANGTLTIEGGRVYLCEFTSFDTSNGPGQEVPAFISSTSGSVMTISVGNRQTVTVGRFIIIHA